MSIKEAEIQVQALLAQYELSNKTTEAGAKVAAQLASSALTAVSASAHIGYAEGRQDSRSYGAQQNISDTWTRQYYHDVTKTDKSRICQEIHSYSEEPTGGCGS